MRVLQATPEEKATQPVSVWVESGRNPPLALSTPASLVVLCVLGAAVFAIRLTGPPNLLDNEYRLGATVLNAVRDGNWICPHDALGNTDKPPLLTWLSAGVTLVVGRVTPFTLYLPTALATLAVSFIVFFAGRREFGARAGFLGGVAYLLSDVGAKQMGTARWDGLFALTVTVAALAAFAAWMRGGGWVWFWLAAAVATLTKGPLGVVLAGSGLLATRWERRSGIAWPLRGSHVVGVLVFLAVTLGWFLLAYRRAGPHLIDDMIGQELVGHVVEHVPGRRALKPVADFLVNFGPWSLLACAALVRVVRHPASDFGERRFERFLVCWWLVGLGLFSLSPHNPSRLLWPVVPAAALLAGRELAHLTRRLEPRMLARGAVVAGIASSAIFLVEYHYLARRDPDVQATRALLTLADQVRREGGDLPLQFVDTSPALELALDVERPPLSFEEAAARLRGPAPVVVAIENRARLERLLGTDGPSLHELARTTVAGRPYVYVLANRAEWNAGPDQARDLAGVHP